jgi:hypothetical protein
MVSTARSDSASARLSLAPFVAGIICVIVVHVATVFLLYGSRAFVRSFAAPPELVVFLFPAVGAFAGYYFLLRARAVRMILLWVGAFLLTFLSLWLSLLLAFNTNGT